MSQSPSATLVAREVSKSFGPRVVLDAVSVTVPPGSRIGIVAPNGTGKSTLLRLLAGLDVPDRGTVSRLPPAATVGFLPQEPDRRVGETLRAFLGRRTGVTDAVDRVRRRDGSVERGPQRCRRRVHTCARAIPRAGRAGLRRACGGHVARVGLPERLLDLPMPAMSGGQAAARVAGGDPALTLRRLPARRADERPRLRRPRPARVVPCRAPRRRRHRLPRPRLPRSHHRRRARAR